MSRPACVSSLADLTEGRFRAVVDDPRAPQSPKRVVLCSGKIYYDLQESREQQGRDDVAIYRVELLYPFPVERLQAPPR